MARSISIKNTKGIKNFCFTFPDQNDVYLLVGPNGIGKTTLLTCMDRICNPYAFARGFSRPRNVAGYDEYINSEIQYNVDDICVNFRKSKLKWAATPRKDNAELLKSFGYSNSVFIKADSKRIDATQDEIEKGSVKPADHNIIQTLNTIFETDKYNNLKKLKVTHGRGKPSTFFNIIKDGTNYYTEKRFSTGELAILHLIQSIENAADGSIVLLDEAEIALHPRVQINLLNYLKEKAVEKEITVFISTHSPTMIKATNPKQILMLDSDKNGTISLHTPCYPARALGRIDYEESNIFDYIFFVEDDMARSFLKKLVNRYIALVPKHSTALTSIIPVGGFYETARMAVNTNNQLFGKSKVFAFLDTDAFQDLEHKPKFSELYNKNNNKDLIKDLTITPELKFIEILSSNDAHINNIFKENFHCELNSIFSATDYIDCSGDNERAVAKRQFAIIIQHCCSACGDCEQIVIDRLINLVTDSFSDGEIQRILGPVFNQ